MLGSDMETTGETHWDVNDTLMSVSDLQYNQKYNEIHSIHDSRITSKRINLHFPFQQQ